MYKCNLLKSLEIKLENYKNHYILLSQHKKKKIPKFIQSSLRRHTATSFQTTAHATPGGDLTLRRQHYLPPSYAWAHRRPWLASVAIIERGKRVCLLSLPESTGQVCSLELQAMDGYSITGIRTRNSPAMTWPLFCCTTREANKQSINHRIQACMVLHNCRHSCI